MPKAHARAALFPGYPKTYGPFKRDPENGHAIDTTRWTSPQLEWLHDNHVPMTWTRKLDGTNIRLCWDGLGTVSIGGRTGSAEIPGPLLAMLEEEYTGDTTVGQFEDRFGALPAVVFGEGYGPGIQGNPEEVDGVRFAAFDVWVSHGPIVDDEPLSSNYGSFASIAELNANFGDIIPLAPTVATGLPIGDAIGYVRHGMAQNCEGLIGLPAVPLYNEFGGRVKVKLKRNNVGE